MKYQVETSAIKTLALGVEKKKGPLQQSVLSWADDHPARYAWHAPGVTVYQVLIGEILLEKLKEAAAAAYAHFLELYPSIDELLGADDEIFGKVLADINLQVYHERFRKLVSGLAGSGRGELPRDTDTLGRISGLPRHHVKAVFSFGYGLPIAVVDPNVARMLANIFAADLPASPPTGLIESVAEGLVCYYEPRKYNGAMLDLAELVCGPDMSRCRDCPVNSLCDAVPGVRAFTRSLVKII